MDQCSNIKSATADVKLQDHDAMNQAEAEIDALVKQTQVHATMEAIEKRVKESGRDELTEKEFDKLFKANYKGKDPKKALLIAKLLGTLKGNDIRRTEILDMIFIEAIKDVPSRKKSLKHAMKLNPIDLQEEGGLVDMMSMKYTTLNRIYWRSWNWSKANEKFDTFAGRNFRIPLMRPKNLKYRDSSGAYSIMEKSVSTYLGRVLTHTNRFWGAWPEKMQQTKNPNPPPAVVNRLQELANMYKARKISKQDYLKRRQQLENMPWRRDYGMTDILADVSSMAIKIKGQNTSEKKAKDYLTDFFQMYGTGWITLKDGEFYINAEYSQDKQFPGKPDLDMISKRFEDTGDIKFSFKKPIKIEDYDPKKHSKLDLRVQSFLKRHIMLAPELVKEMEMHNRRALMIHHEVYEYLNGPIAEGPYENMGPNTGAFA